MTSLSSLQADARAKFDEGFTKKGGRYGNSTYMIRDVPEVKAFLDEIILSTILAVRDEVVPEALRTSGVVIHGLRTDGDSLSILVKFEANHNSIAVYDNMKLLAAFDSLLGGDAKRV